MSRRPSAALFALAVACAIAPSPLAAQKPAQVPQPTGGGGTGQWVASQGGAIPPGAIPTGYEAGGFLYTCRGQAEGGLHAGKVRPGFDGCYIPLGGHETTIRAYDVLVGNSDWVIARDGAVPPGSVEVGRTRTGQILYACRAAGAPGQLVPGKTGAGLRGCNIGVGGNEVTQGMYEVLVQR